MDFNTNHIFIDLVVLVVWLCWAPKHSLPLGLSNFGHLCICYTKSRMITATSCYASLELGHPTKHRCMVLLLSSIDLSLHLPSLHLSSLPLSSLPFPLPPSPSCPRQVFHVPRQRQSIPACRKTTVCKGASLQLVMCNNMEITSSLCPAGG